MHVPLELNLSALSEDRVWKDISLFRLRDVLRQEGIGNQPYLCGSAFWIVHHDAIETVYDLALGFWHRAKDAGLIVDVSAALGYAMQILCADPEAHRLMNHLDLWGSDNEGYFREILPDGTPWIWRHPFGTECLRVRPAIIHLPQSKERLAAALSQA